MIIARMVIKGDFAKVACSNHFRVSSLHYWILFALWQWQFDCIVRLWLSYFDASHISCLHMGVILCWRGTRPYGWMDLYINDPWLKECWYVGTILYLLKHVSTTFVEKNCVVWSWDKTLNIMPMYFLKYGVIE